MLISVIVPVYNVECYLKSCIESILMQTFNDFELILVDDGSPDHCGEICDEYVQKDSRVRVIHQLNQGLSAARNNAIDVAKGDYLTFVDSDDFILPHCLEVLLNLCRENNADISACNMVRCLSTDSLSDVKEQLTNKKNEVFQDDKMEVFFCTQKITTTACGKLYKRCLFESVRYPVGRCNEDIFTVYKIVHYANKVAYLDYYGYVYRINENSIVNESYSPRKWDAIDACLERKKFIELNYPKQKKYACRAIVHYCNHILISMAASSVYDKKVLDQLQRLYREYVWYYVFCKSSVLGKFFAAISCANVKITYFFIKKIKR